MKCLESERLISYAYRLIDEPSTSEVRSHLEECAHGRGIVEQYGRLDAVLSEWKAAEPGPEFDVRVRQAVEVQQAQREAWGFWGWEWARGLALASLGVTLVAGVVWLNQHHRGISNPSTIATRQQQKGARISGQTLNSQVPGETTQADTAPGQQVPPVESASSASSDDRDAQAMEDYDLAANFELLSEIPKGGTRVVN